MNLMLALIFAIGGVICHQRPERSFFVDGHQLPVCARCTGLYLGAFAGLAGWIVIRLVRRGERNSINPRVALTVLIVAGVPTAISVAGGILGIADGTNAWRAGLALPLGAVAGAIVTAVAAKDLR